MNSTNPDKKQQIESIYNDILKNVKTAFIDLDSEKPSTTNYIEEANKCLHNNSDMLKEIYELSKSNMPQGIKDITDEDKNMLYGQISRDSLTQNDQIALGNLFGSSHIEFKPNELPDLMAILETHLLICRELQGNENINWEQDPLSLKVSTPPSRSF